jgi:hypothetical protein
MELFLIVDVVTRCIKYASFHLILVTMAIVVYSLSVERAWQ